jgi:uncharacterized protein YneF (UPF0154 family)
MVDWILAVIVLVAGLIVGFVAGITIVLSERSKEPRPNYKGVRLVKSDDGNPGRREK